MCSCEQRVLRAVVRRRRPRAARGSATALRCGRRARSASSAATATPISTATMRSNTTVAAAVSDEHDGVGARGAEHRADVADLDHPHRGDHEHAGQRRQRDAGHEPAAEAARRASSTSAWTIAATPGAGAGPHVDRGAGDRAGGGHAAEERRREVGQALAEQLAVGVVALAVGHAVGDLGRQQALQRGEQRRPRARRSSRSCRSGPSTTEASDGHGQRRRAARRCVRRRGRRSSATTVATTTAISDAGQRPVQRAAATTITAATSATSASAVQAAVAAPARRPRAPRPRAVFSPSGLGTPSATGPAGGR